MLYLIGIGLGNEKDITVKGLEIVKKCELVYLENYTSVLQASLNDLEKFYGKKIIMADREMVENKNEIIENAKKKNVALLIVGSPLMATTHIDLLLRAEKEKIKTQVIDNASILTSIGITGLSLYKFGAVTSIPLENKNVKSPIDVVKKNMKNELHSLVLFDLDVKNNRFMKVNDAADYLIENDIDENLLAIGCSALGSENEIKAGKLKELREIKFNKFPQCLVIPAKKLHFVEEEAIKRWKLK